MPKMEIRIGLGDKGEGEGMGDYESGFYEAKDRVIAMLGMANLKATDAESARNEMLKLVEKMECEHGENEGPPSRPSGAGMPDAESEDY